MKTWELVVIFVVIISLMSISYYIGLNEEKPNKEDCGCGGH